MHTLHRSRFVLGLLLGLVACTARAITVEEIPTPRPTGWAVDLIGTGVRGSLPEALDPRSLTS